MTGKADLGDIEGRIRDIRADPSNERIVRVPHAGEIVDGHLVTHNGLLVKPVDPGYVLPLQGNGGCHEPQEELVFQEVLKHIPRGGTMVEVGAYWGFYSMWFAKEVAGARCICVEPRKKNLKVGKYNFAKNGLTAEFIRGKIGCSRMGVDDFLKARRLDFVNILHADIQGAEHEMLCSAEQSLRAGKIGYVFVGTHSQELHYQCKAVLERCGYVTIAHADFDHGSYCCDGVLIARHQDVSGLEPLDLPLRDPAAQHQAEQQMKHLRFDPPAPPIRQLKPTFLQRLKRKLLRSHR